MTRFRIRDASSPGGSRPADPLGTVTAIAANAGNDAWASTTSSLGASGQPPHLYRLTNGQTPDAPEGNDEEPARPLPKQEEENVSVEEPPPPLPPVVAPATVTQTKSLKLPAAIYDVKAKLHTSRRHGKLYLSLYVTFKLRRPATVGVKALRKGRVVSEARPALRRTLWNAHPEPQPPALADQGEFHYITSPSRIPRLGLQDCSTKRSRSTRVMEMPARGPNMS